MKFIAAIIFITCTAQAYAGTATKQSRISSIEITGDTVWSNGSAYCLLAEQDGTYIIRTLSRQSIIYLQPVQQNGSKRYRIAFAPLNKVYYAPYDGGFVNSFLHKCIKYGIVEEDYFSAYGANTLIKESKDAGVFLEEWEIPVAAIPATPPKAMDWNISWKATTNTDSIIILNNGTPFAYYIHRSWKSYGIDSWAVIKATNADYRYLIYKLDHTLMAEVRVQDGWKTNIKILTPDGEQYSIKDVPDNKDFMTIAVKLLLAKESATK